MYTTDMQTQDFIGLLNDVRYLQANHGPAMDKLSKMKHASLVYRLNNGAEAWKKLLKRAVSRTPKIRFPYGIEAAGVTTYSSLGK